MNRRLNTSVSFDDHLKIITTTESTVTHRLDQHSHVYGFERGLLPSFHAFQTHSYVKVPLIKGFCLLFTVLWEKNPFPRLLRNAHQRI